MKDMVAFELWPGDTLDGLRIGEMMQRLQESCPLFGESYAQLRALCPRRILICSFFPVRLIQELISNFVHPLRSYKGVSNKPLAAVLIHFLLYLQRSCLGVYILFNFIV